MEEENERNTTAEELDMIVLNFVCMFEGNNLVGVRFAPKKEIQEGKFFLKNYFHLIFN